MMFNNIYKKNYFMVQFEMKEYNYLIHVIHAVFYVLKFYFYLSYLNVARAKFSQFSSELNRKP